MDVMAQTVGEVIGELLGARRVRDVAAELDVSTTTINNWRNGKIVPTLRNAKKLDDLLGGDGRVVAAVIEAMANGTGAAPERLPLTQPEVDSPRSSPGSDAVLGALRELREVLRELETEVHQLRAEVRLSQEAESTSPPTPGRRQVRRPPKPSSNHPPQ
jgi:DNA-binding XRE family transcriptional regulator